MSMMIRMAPYPSVLLLDAKRQILPTAQYLMNELDIKVVNYVYHNKNGDVLNSTNMSIKELDSAINDQNK